MTDQEREEIRQWAAEVMGWERVYADGIPMWKLPSGRWDVINWHPDTDLNQAFMMVGKLMDRNYDVEIFFNKEYGIEVEISYGEKHPNYPKGGCRESGDERVALETVKTIEELASAIIRAAKATGVK